MGYPNISQYIETLSNPHGLFRTLKVEPKHDRHGGIMYVSGSRSVIFYVTADSGEYVLKCYTRRDEERHSAYKSITDTLAGDDSGYPAHFRFVENEIMVFGTDGKGEYYPLLLMEDVKGKTLAGRLRELCACKDKKGLGEIARRFDDMGIWLLGKDFAHGDLKHDNIIVSPNGNLRLIDFDGMFTPDMEGRTASELGTRNFQHPRRDRNFFNRHIDDYSIALISASLHALEDFPELYEEYYDDEKILFSPEELTSGKCQLINKLKDHWLSNGRTSLYRLASMLCGKSPELPGLGETLKLISEEGRNHSVRTAAKDNGMSIIRKDGFYGFRNPATGETIDTVYDDVTTFSEGLAAVRIMKRWHYIDSKGKKVIDAREFDEAGIFREGLAAVGKSGRYGYINLNGDLVIPLSFGNARNFSEGLAGVKINGKYGFINHEGDMVIPAIYDSISDFRNSTAVVEKEGLFGYIAPDGSFLVEPRFDFASTFRNGRATAESGNKRYELIMNKDSIIYEE